MLNSSQHLHRLETDRTRLPSSKQSGVALIVALIMLVILTLAALSLARSVDTSNLVAGNLAFQRAATQYGDVGTEQAVTWLQGNSAGGVLWNDSPAAASAGYSASTQTIGNPGSNQNWDDYWNNTIATAPPGIVTLPVDPVTGNQVSYSIQRLCAGPGDPSNVAAAANCAQPPATAMRCITQPCLRRSAQQYYRITSRVAGPRNTVSYIQTIIAM